MRQVRAEVLLIEDDATDAALIVRALKKTELGGSVYVAKDGEEALDYVFGTGAFAASPGHPDLSLVLLDLRLPGVHGIEVLRRLKGDARTRAIPVVVITGSQISRDVEQCFALGAHSYIPKPFDLAMFIEEIKELGLHWLETHPI